MAGTYEGGLKAAETNKERYGEDYYQVIGARGGEAVVATKGFGSNKELASEVGRKGGKAGGRGRPKLQASKLHDSTEI
jgi:general stress protein YciG